jgi:hypothetical protein
MATCEVAIDICQAIPPWMNSTVTRYSSAKYTIALAMVSPKAAPVLVPQYLQKKNSVIEPTTVNTAASRTLYEPLDDQGVEAKVEIEIKK